MSLKKNIDEPINLPTISSFIKFISNILDVETIQRKEVIQGRTIRSKLSRLNDDYLQKIIDSLMGLDILPPDWKISDENEENLTFYKSVAREHVEFCEIIISLGSNQFHFQHLEKKQLIEDYIFYLIIPYMNNIFYQQHDFPLFSPFYSLLDIATKLFINPNDAASITMRSYLKEKFRSIKTSDYNFDIYDSLSYLDEEEIIKSKTLAFKIKSFTDFLRNKKNIPEIEIFIGAYRCCVILLRLKKELGDNSIFQFFIRALIIRTSLTQKYSPLDKKLTLFIKPQYLKPILDEVTENEFANFKDNRVKTDHLYNSFVSYVMVKSELNELTDTEKSKNKCLKEIREIRHNYLKVTNFTLLTENEYEFLEFCFEQVITTTLSLFENFSHFKKDNQSPITHLLTTNFRYQPLSNNEAITKTHLIELKKMAKVLNKPYQEAVIHYIDLLQSFIEGKINDCFSLAEKIIKDDSKKWNLGKLKSDAFLIYIVLGNMNKFFVGNVFNSILNQYYECQPPQFNISIIDSKQNNITIDEAIIKNHMKAINNDFFRFMLQLNLENDLIYEKFLETADI